MYLVSCTNTHHDVTDSVNHGMVKNTKIWISWEWNIIFPRNKKITNLCLRWHILRSYRFVEEVTFKQFKILSIRLRQICSFIRFMWKIEVFKDEFNIYLKLLQESCIKSYDFVYLTAIIVCVAPSLLPIRGKRKKKVKCHSVWNLRRLLVMVIFGQLLDSENAK